MSAVAPHRTTRRRPAHTGTLCGDGWMSVWCELGSVCACVGRELGNVYVFACHVLGNVCVCVCVSAVCLASMHVCWVCF